MAKKQMPVWAQDWFAKIIEQSKFQVHTIPLKTSREWVIDNGTIAHKSGLFFKIVGVSWAEKKHDKYIRPLIEQREIGTLGFLLQKKHEPQILVQAKLEPGNIGLCQIGPTFQATASNAARVHGGKTPAYKKYFELGAKNVILQTLQSEQGTRFLGKLNRNMVVQIQNTVRPNHLHKWVNVSKLLSVIDVDHFINTDSRSVLVCMPWYTLVEREPFSSTNGKLVKQLKLSYKAVNVKKIRTVNGELGLKRAKTAEPRVITLDSMPGWKMTAYGVKNLNAKPYTIKQVAVTAYGREVAHWDQPIIDSNSNGYADLYCAIIDGILRFYFVARAEAGLFYRVELGPSFMSEPGQKNSSKPFKKYTVLATVNQSDEGGRFFRDVTRYRLLQISEHNSRKLVEGYWLTLGEVCELLKIEGIFTNEARSVLSLLLKWV